MFQQENSQFYLGKLVYHLPYMTHTRAARTTHSNGRHKLGHT